LACRGTMRTLDIIGIDFQLWLGIDLSPVGEQQVGIALIGFYFLTVAFDDDLTIEHTMSPVIENAFVVLMGIGVRRVMVGQSMIVHVLATMAVEQTSEGHLGTLAIEIADQVVANESTTQCQVQRGELGIAPLLYVDTGHVQI